MFNEIIYSFPKFNGATVQVIQSDTLLGMWSIIQAGIKVRESTDDHSLDLWLK